MQGRRGKLEGRESRLAHPLSSAPNAAIIIGMMIRVQREKLVADCFPRWWWRRPDAIGGERGTERRQRLSIRHDFRCTAPGDPER